MARARLGRLRTACVVAAASALAAAAGCAPRSGTSSNATEAPLDNYLGGPSAPRKPAATDPAPAPAGAKARKAGDFPAVGSKVELELYPAGAESTSQVSTVTGVLAAVGEKWVLVDSKSIFGGPTTVWVPRHRISLIVASE